MLVVGIIVSIIVQLSAAVLAFSLIRHTKFNISWIFFSMAFLFMGILLFFQLKVLLRQPLGHTTLVVSNVMSIVTSLLIFVGVIFIKKIFNLQKRIDQLRKQSENRVLHAVIATEEKERQRFAKDLHDGLGPLLSMMKMSVSALQKSEMKPQDREIITNIDTLVTESITTIREVANNISPHILDNFGLTSAINSFVAKITSKHPISIVVQSLRPDERLGYNTEVVLYRVILELITNSLKHSEASSASISIISDDHQLRVVYKDDGRGFDADKLMQYQSGMGFSNISSRVKSIHGTLEIESRPLEGMQVTIMIKK
jgi:signal transduction histidine kinase